MPDPIDWGLALPYYLAAFALGYVLGSIPFGLIFTRLAGTEDIRDHRIQEHWRNQCLENRPQRTGSPDIGCGRAQGNGGGSCRFPVGPGYGNSRRAWRVYRSPGARLAEIPRRQGRRDLYRHPARALIGPRRSRSAPSGCSSRASAAIRRLPHLAASAATPALLAYFGQWQAELFVVLSLLVYVRHWANIRRLVSGTESKIGGNPDDMPFIHDPGRGTGAGRRGASQLAAAHPQRQCGRGHLP